MKSNNGDDKSKPKKTVSAVPQNRGTAIPPEVVKKTVEIALTKKDAIEKDASTKLADQSKRDREDEELAKKHGLDEEKRLMAMMSEEEKASHLKFLAAKQAHRDQAVQEERKRMQAEREAPGKAGALGAQASDVAKKIQPDISSRAEAANKAREEKLASEEATAKLHALQEKQRREKQEADRKAKADRAQANAPTFLPKPNQPAKVFKKAPVAVPTPVSTSKPVLIEDIDVAKRVEPFEVAPVSPVQVPVVPDIALQPEKKGPMTRQRKARSLVEELKSKEVENRQQASEKAEKARLEIAQRLRKATLIKRASLIATSAVSSLSLWLSGIGPYSVAMLAKMGVVFPAAIAAPVTLPIVVGLVLGVGLYYVGKSIISKVNDIYQRFKFTDKQRYQRELDYHIKVNVSLERQFDPTLQKAMLEKLDLLAAHAVDPTFNEQDIFINKPSCNKLTVVQFENKKLEKRAFRSPEACAKWDEKFLNQDENSIYLKVAKKK
jgi:predicted flap endonuclease-1-like 5' DNA nuclease